MIGIFAQSTEQARALAQDLGLPIRGKWAKEGGEGLIFLSPFSAERVRGITLDALIVLDTDMTEEQAETVLPSLRDHLYFYKITRELILDDRTNP